MHDWASEVGAATVDRMHGKDQGTAIGRRLSMVPRLSGRERVSVNANKVTKLQETLIYGDEMLIFCERLFRLAGSDLWLSWWCRVPQSTDRHCVVR